MRQNQRASGDACDARSLALRVKESMASRMVVEWCAPPARLWAGGAPEARTTPAPPTLIHGCNRDNNTIVASNGPASLFAPPIASLHSNGAASRLCSGSDSRMTRSAALTPRAMDRFAGKKRNGGADEGTEP